MDIIDSDIKKKKVLKLALNLYGNDIESLQRDLSQLVESNESVATSINRSRYQPIDGAEPIISVKNLSRVYKSRGDEVRAVKNVSFDVYPGEFVALTGSSGSGKSTLLHMIGGLDKPSNGSILINKTDLTKMSDSKLSTFRNRTVGFVFQFFYLQPFLNLSQNIAVPSMVFSMSSKERRKRAQELAEAVGIAERLRHMPKELSGGQMQRAAIARALFNKPKILIADEPTGNLDSKNAMAIMELFHKIRKEFGTTIIVVTHDEKVANLADRQLVMHDGELI